jgi:hypothetical protein
VCVVQQWLDVALGVWAKNKISETVASGFGLESMSSLALQNGEGVAPGVLECRPPDPSAIGTEK